MQENQDSGTLGNTTAEAATSQEVPTGKTDMQTNKILALVSHLGPLSGVGFIIAPAIIWYLNKTNEFVAEHAKQAMFYQGLMGIFGVIFGTFSFAASILTGGLAAFLLLPASLLVSLVALIPALIAAYKSMNAETYNYPVSGALSKKF